MSCLGICLPVSRATPELRSQPKQRLLKPWENKHVECCTCRVCICNPFHLTRRQTHHRAVVRNNAVAISTKRILETPYQAPCKRVRLSWQVKDMMQRERKSKKDNSARRVQRELEEWENTRRLGRVVELLSRCVHHCTIGVMPEPFFSTMALLQKTGSVSSGSLVVFSKDLVVSGRFLVCFSRWKWKLGSIWSSTPRAL